MKSIPHAKNITLILCGIGLLFIGFLFNDALSKLIKLDEEASTVETGTFCNEASLYISNKEQKIFTYCLDTVKVNVNDEKVELKDQYKKDSKIIDSVINKMTEKNVYKDGGSVLFVSEINDLAVLKCKTLDGNTDIYIGHKDMEYEKGFCETGYPSIEEEEFEIIYHVYNIISMGDDDYKFVTLYEPNGNTVETVKVKSELLLKVKKDKNYIFKFKSKDVPFKSDIKNVFEKSDVVDIYEYKK